MAVIPTKGGKPILTPNGGVLAKSAEAAGARVGFTASLVGSKVKIVLDEGSPVTDLRFFGKTVRNIVAGEINEYDINQISKDPDIDFIWIRSRVSGTTKWGPRKRLSLEGIDPPTGVTPFAFVGVPTLVLSKAEVGGTITYTPATLTGDYNTAVDVLQSRVGTGAWVDETSFWSVVQAAMLGKTLRAGTRVIDTFGVLFESYTIAPFPFIEDVPALSAKTPTLDDVGWIEDSAFYKPSGQTVYRGAYIQVDGLLDELTGSQTAEFRWSGTNPANVPNPTDAQSDVLVEVADGVYEQRMDVTADNVSPIGSASGTVLAPDFSRYTTTTAARNDWVRISWRIIDGSTTSDWSSWSPAIGSVPDVIEPPVQTVRLARPFYLRTPSVNNKPVNHPEFYDKEAYGGEGLQAAHVFTRGGARSWFGGDMCGIRYCDDNGRFYNPEGNGLRGCVFAALGIDPEDEDRIICAVGTEAFRTVPSIGTLGDIYLSTNVAKDFTRCTLTSNTGSNVANLRTHPRTTTGPNPIAWLPDWTDHTTPATRSWRYIEWGPSTTRQWHSNNGGSTFTQGPNLPTALQSAQVYRVVAHPTNKDIWWLCTNVGLWKTTNDGTSFTRISDTIFTGTVRMLWIDPENADRGLCATVGGAMRVTTNLNNATPTWTSVGPAAGGQGNHGQSFAVSGKWSETVGGVTTDYRTIYFAQSGTGNSQTAHARPYIQHWKLSGNPSSTKFSGGVTGSVNTLPAGTAAPREQWFLPRLSPTGTENDHWTKMCAEGHTNIAASQLDPEMAVIHGYGLNFFTTNRGADWNACSGYGGMNSQNMTFSKDYPYDIAFAMNDIGIIDGWYEPGEAHPSRVNFGGFGQAPYQNSVVINGQTVPITNFFNEMKYRIYGDPRVGQVGGIAACILPNHANLPVGRRGARIFAVGDYGDNHILITRVRGGTTWDFWRDTNGNIINGQREIREINYDANPLFVFAGSSRSVNGGVNWTLDAMGSGRRVLATHPTVVGTAWAKNGDDIIQKTTNSTATTPTWSNWATNLSVGDRMFWLREANVDQAISRGIGGDLVLIRAGMSNLDLNLRGQYNGMIPDTDNPDNSNDIVVSGGGWCPLNTYKFTAYAKVFGGPMLWECIFNSQFLDGNTSAYVAGTYGNNVRVTRNGKVWRSTAASNTTVPGDVGATWADEGAIYTWTNVSRNIPKTANTRDCEIHPISGERFVSSGFGICVLPADGALPSMNFYNLLPKPFIPENSVF